MFFYSSLSLFDSIACCMSALTKMGLTVFSKQMLYRFFLNHDLLIVFPCVLQLLVAQFLSTSYALIMMAVFVGTALQLGEDGVGSPSAIFLSCMMGSFFIAAILHPQEFKCILPILIYFLSIPSMYLLLILYSIINLNVVSWGTREVQVKKTKKVLHLSET